MAYIDLSYTHELTEDIPYLTLMGNLFFNVLNKVDC